MAAHRAPRGAWGQNPAYRSTRPPLPPLTCANTPADDLVVTRLVTEIRLRLMPQCNCVTMEAVMAVRRDGNTWYFVIDLPRGEDDRRRLKAMSGSPFSSLTSSPPTTKHCSEALVSIGSGSAGAVGSATQREGC